MSKNNQQENHRQQPRRESLEQGLARHPELKSQREALLAIVENRAGRLELADDAEWAILQQVRQMGGQALREWGQQQADRKASEMLQLNPSACKDKKNSALE
jgi:histidinol dehydrogenase